MKSTSFRNINKSPALFLIASASLLALVSGWSQTTFTKIITGPVATDEGQFVRHAWGDFRNSGLLDLVVCNWGGRTNVYYLNNGNGTFTKATHGDPVQEADYHASPTIGDFDNDGFLDLTITAGVGAPTARHNLFFHNNGDGTFSRQGGAGVTNLLGSYDANAAVDYDNDGLLDLFVTQDGGLTQLWHNNGDGTFTRITSGPAVSDAAPVWGDYDNDGFMDLFLPVGTSTGNVLYHNNRNGTFTRVLTNTIATDPFFGGAEAAAWGDYDNDGLQDLFVTGDNGSPNRLYHNEGSGRFTIVTGIPMATRPAGTDSLGCAWGDYDNDGYLDLFVTSHGGHNTLYHNNGDGTFTQVLSGDLVNDGGPGYSLCGWVDYDNDGFLDLFISQNNLATSTTTNLLYHNNGNTNGWLELRLAGRASNRSAIGAKVHVLATIGGRTLWQMREITTGGGRNVQPLVAHFGLGDATNVDLVRIEWPSGIVQILTNVAPRQILNVVEHQARGAQPPVLSAVTRPPNGAVTFSASGDAGRVFLLEASTNLVNWMKLGVTSNGTGSVSFTDTNAAKHVSRFYRASIP